MSTRCVPYKFTHFVVGIVQTRDGTSWTVSPPAGPEVPRVLIAVNINVTDCQPNRLPKLLKKCIMNLNISLLYFKTEI